MQHCNNDSVRPQNIAQTETDSTRLSSTHAHTPRITHHKNKKKKTNITVLPLQYYTLRRVTAAETLKSK